MQVLCGLEGLEMERVFFKSTVVYFSFIPFPHAKKVVPFGKEKGKRIKD